MHILVFGHIGQVATELRVLSTRDLTITALDCAAADLTDLAACAAAIDAHAPDAVINAAAYKGVDCAKVKEVTAHSVNADATAAMAAACAARDISFVTISTNYFFSGEGKTDWTPQDTPTPKGAYGRTKQVGERGVAAGRWAVLRAFWVISAHGNNFAKTMLRLGAERDVINVVVDQIGNPTGAAEIAATSVTIAQKLEKGTDVVEIYHFAGVPTTSWADFARAIFTEAELCCAVTNIPSSAYPTPATRQLNSRMDCSTTTATFGIAQPQWQASLTAKLRDLGQQQNGTPCT